MSHKREIETTECMAAADDNECNGMFAPNIKIKKSIINEEVKLESNLVNGNSLCDEIVCRKRINDDIKLSEDMTCDNIKDADMKPNVDDVKEANDSNSIIYNKQQKKKICKILTALADDDIEYLRKACILPGGLLNDDIRQKVWPKLVGVDMFETSPRPSREVIEEHPYYRQVVLDVNRSLKRFPPSIKEAQRLAMQDQLVLLIMRVLYHHPEFHYYQGYHDICVTFLLVLGEEMAFYVIEALSTTHLNVFMEKTMEPTIELLNYMYPLIGKKDPKLMNFLYKSEVGVAYCLSWLITWFGHVLNNYIDVVRLFDFFIVSDPWMPMYLTSVIVLHRQVEVMEQECDMACVHSLLSRVPDDALPFEELIQHSLKLYASYKPKLLKKERSVLTKKKNHNLVQSVVKSIKKKVPANNFTFSLVIAAAVFVTAVLYQAYKY